MKKTFLLMVTAIASTLAFGQTQLNGVTFGFGAGYSWLKHTPYSYSLSTDNSKNLRAQELSKNAFVISSAISVKLTKLAVSDDNKVVRYKSDGSTENAGFWGRFSLNASLNLIELSNSEVSFNKSIDGGIGIGYFISDNVQGVLFYDIINRRQLRDYIVNDYLGKPIPNGTSFYNALDETDNSLFYNKMFTGFSLKIVISIGNKKPS